MKSRAPLIDFEHVPLPAAEVEKARIVADRERERKWRYEQRSGRKIHGTRITSGTPGSTRAIAAEEYPFIGFDGEGFREFVVDSSGLATCRTFYGLLGCTDGDYIRGTHLTTEDCFEFFLGKKRDNPKSIFIIFGGRYDFDEIFRMSMPWRRISQLKTFGETYWRGYKIKQVEGKFCDIAKDGLRVRVFEIHGWFHSSYEKALETYKISVSLRDKKEIAEGKKARGTFTWSNVDNVTRYMLTELRYMSPLMDCIRGICLDAGFRPRSWYGPSALATELLTRNRIKDYMGTIHSDVNLAAQFAYAGGRFEMPRGGIVNYPIYSADWNSAYMTAALELPCLTHGRWRHGKRFEPGKFGVYHIRYYETDSERNPVGINHRRIYPLFRRYPNGNVHFGNRVEGWYWSPEAALVQDSRDATFLESWIWDAECTHKPFAFVGDLYNHRITLENLPEDNPSRAAALAFKWALAAIYGQIVRRVGWDRKRKLPPKYHCLEWGGYITSRCRAEMFELAQKCGDKLLSIDTDSVTAMCPIPIADDAIGRRLGQWKVSRADGGIFFQNGIYCTHTNGDYSFKSRGIEKEAQNRIHRNITSALSPELLSQSIKSGIPVELRPKSRYVTLRMALNNRIPDAGKWELHESDRLLFGGGGKRYHNLRSCSRTCNDGLHLFLHNIPMPTRQNIGDHNIHSTRYPLPWKGETAPLDMNLIRDIVWIDPDHLEDDEYWLAKLAERTTGKTWTRANGAELTAGVVSQKEPRGGVVCAE